MGPSSSGQQIERAEDHVECFEHGDAVGAGDRGLGGPRLRQRRARCARLQMETPALRLASGLALGTDAGGCASPPSGAVALLIEETLQAALASGEACEELHRHELRGHDDHDGDIHRDDVILSDDGSTDEDAYYFDGTRFVHLRKQRCRANPISDSSTANSTRAMRLPILLRTSQIGPSK